MIPDIDTQLAAVIKSITDNVLPAVDPANQLAQEQLYLSLATLKLVRQHLPHMHTCLRRDLVEQIALANNLIAVGGADVGALTQTIADTGAALTNPENGSEMLLSAARILRDGIGRFLIANQGDERFDAIVLSSSLGGITRGRAWNKGMGFEPNPDAVPDLDVLLGS